MKEFLKFVKIHESTISMLFGVLVVVAVALLVMNNLRGKEQAPKLTPSQVSRTDNIKEAKEEKQPTLPTTHKVVAGEHLWGIAEKYYKSGYNWVDLAKANNLTNPQKISVGQELTIPDVPARKPTVQAKTTVFGPPIEGTSYTVVRGDHLWGIAVRAYGDGYKWVDLAKANNLTKPSLIHAGLVLTIPRK